MKENVLFEKSLQFGKMIFQYAIYLRKEKREYKLSDQILRSGTSIGANISEANCSISKAEFISKMQISLKETNETLYWLKLFDHTEYAAQNMDELKESCEEIKKMLISSIKTAKGNSKKNYEIK